MHMISIQNLQYRKESDLLEGEMAEYHLGRREDVEGMVALKDSKSLL